MKTTVRYIILTAVRDWLFFGLLSMLVIAYAISYLFGATSLVEERATSLAFCAGSSRLLMVTGLIVFTCFHLRRGFDTKEIDIILTKPISRISFIISYWLGLSAVAIILAMASIAVILIGSGGKMDIGMLTWSVSLVFECLIAVSLALAVSLIFKSAVTAVMGSFCFYAMARMAGFFVSMVEQDRGAFSNGFEGVGAMLLKGISIFMPRLDQFTQSEWLVHGVTGTQELLLITTQSVIYIPLLISLSYFDFRRREF